EQGHIEYLNKRRLCGLLGFLVAGFWVAGSAWAQNTPTGEYARHEMELEIGGAWVRPTVAGQSSTGAYLVFKSDTNGELIGAESEVASLTELHEMVMEGDVMRMRHVISVPVKAGEPLEFKPGGYHLMLMDLKAPILEGQKVAVSLLFRTATGKITKVPFTAKAAMMDQPPRKRRYPFVQPGTESEHP
ncbi:MAG: copper chaperone PCu(A)C, partial [Limnobacter sp.]|nr:copper chaperone PCu(A)C [Limnobacter sp.]